MLKCQYSRPYILLYFNNSTSYVNYEITYKLLLHPTQVGQKGTLNIN